MNYKIISSGSNGNCVIIENIMIDLGVSYKLIKEHLYFVKYIFLTHNHSDHIKPGTFRSIRKQFPNIKIIGPYEVALKYELDHIANAGVEFKVGNKIISPFLCPHDVLNLGYVWTDKGKNIIYATDTTTLEFAPIMKYDYLFIESNHDEKKVAAIMGTHKGYNAFQGAKRHLSTQESRNFYYLNRRDRGSEHIELHRSKRFY